MAETVKKSRIVSDDEENLEEALLEEFNTRLKNCMSEDNLQHTLEQEEDDVDDTLYENLSNIKKPIPKSGIASNDFILCERQSYYDEPISLNNGSKEAARNGHATDDETENIYETLPEHCEIEKTEPMDQYIEMSTPDGEKHNLTLDISPRIEIEHVRYEDCLHLDDTDILESSYEIVEHEHEHEHEDAEIPSFTLKTIDFSEMRSPEEETAKSVKDRMLLATDDAATLLFTQTVTSPMLTPSEENIDFLKGFQRENTNSDNTASNESPPKDVDKGSADNSTSDSGEMFASEPVPNEEHTEEYILKEEAIYENSECIKQNCKNNFENISQNGKIENIYENLESLRKDEHEEEDNEEHIYQDIDDCKKEEDLYERVGDVAGRQTISEEMVDNCIYYKSEDFENRNAELITDLDKTEDSIEIATAKAERQYESIRNIEIVEKAFEACTEHFEALERPSETTKNHFGTIESHCEAGNRFEITEHFEAVANHSEHSERLVNTVQTVESSGEKIEDHFKIVDSSMEEFLENEKETYSEFIHHSKIESNYYEKYTEVVSKTSKSTEISNREKDTETVPPEIVKNLKSQFSKTGAEVVGTMKKEAGDVNEFKTINIMKQINKFEQKDGGDAVTDLDDSTVTQCYTETTTVQSDVPGEKALKKKKTKKSRKEEKENISVNELDLVNGENDYNVNVKNLKSSFSKFDALQKKNVLHVRSSDSTKAQEKFNGTQQTDTTNCKACSRPVFQMEQIKAEKAIWHKNCFRCTECSKQLTVETYVSHEGNLYCKPHFKSLFAPRVVEDEAPPSDKPDLGLEELQSLNVKERFQVFEQHQTETQESDRGPTPVNVKRSPSILSKLARFQAKGMDVGVPDDALNGIPIEETSSEEEEEEEVPEGEDPTLFKAKKAQKEKPFHFTNLSEVKNKWEHGEQNSKDERREERKQEIQSIRNKLFMGKQGKMKEAYQQAVMQSESCANLVKSEKIESCDTKSLKERFEKGQLKNEREMKSGDEEVNEVFQSEISKNSRSLFLELDAHASKLPQISPATPTQKQLDVKKAREAYLAKTSSEDTVKSSEVMEDIIEVKTADIQQRFKFFETYKEPEKERKKFRITPLRDPSQVKTGSPEREIYHDPDVVRSEDSVDDSVIAKTAHTASKMLNKFRQMEENMSREPELTGPKPLKRFTPPPEPTRRETSSEEESGSEEESEGEDQTDTQKIPEDLLEAQKAARAKQLRAKFEKWEAQEIRKEENQTVNIVEEYGDESQIESTKSLRARFESMRETSSDKTRAPRTKVNRFV